jgi:hypothetical protein
MGYQVTITRNGLEEGLIDRDEWLACVAVDPELELEDEADPFPVVVWKKKAVSAEFCWDQQGVWCVSPSDIAILKMLVIARRLDAKVFGEDETEFVVRDGVMLRISP